MIQSFVHKQPCGGCPKKSDASFLNIVVEAQYIGSPLAHKRRGGRLKKDSELMPADRETIEARRDEIVAWLSYGMDIDVTLSSDEPVCFRAENPEFNLVGEGATEEEALDRLIERFTDFLDSFIVSGLPLPDRSDWRAKHPHPPDSDDG